MQFEIYCDEAFPDLLSSKKPQAKYLTIGSLWLESVHRSELKDRISLLREKHGVWGEIKWHKVSRSKLEFYLELIDLFFLYGSRLRFRCIAVDAATYDDSGKWHNNDIELGYYKFHYQLLHHWIFDHNTYRVFCDAKTSSDPTRLHVLRDCLANSNLTADVVSIQALPSRQVVLIQLSDLLLGLASAKLNQSLKPGGAKEALVNSFEQRLGRSIGPTVRSEQKFNVFAIDLQGGW